MRLHAKVNKVANLRGNIRANIGIKLEIEGNRKPAYEGEVVFLYIFNN